MFLSILLLFNFSHAHLVQRPLTPIYQFPIDQNYSGIQEYNVQIVAALLDQEFSLTLNNRFRTWTEKFNWKEPTLGAGSQFDGDDFVVLLYGGMVRARFMNFGVLSAILCHEIGHKMGGPPYQIFFENEPDWSSAEGQADTFAAQVCLPRLFDRLMQFVPNYLNQEVEPTAELLCANHPQRKKCQWVVTSGLDFVQFMQVYFDLEVPFANPSIWSQEQPVATLHTSYPSYQCRMDIFKSAAFQNSERLRCWYAKNPK